MEALASIIDAFDKVSVTPEPETWIILLKCEASNVVLVVMAIGPVSKCVTNSELIVSARFFIGSARLVLIVLYLPLLASLTVPSSGGGGALYSVVGLVELDLKALRL